MTAAEWAEARRQEWERANRARALRIGRMLTENRVLLMKLRLATCKPTA